MPWTGPSGSEFDSLLFFLEPSTYWLRPLADKFTQPSFSITHGPTPTERQLMEDWIQILVNFVNDTEGYEYGTNSVEEMKVLTPEATIEVRPDGRWSELVKLGNIFAGK